MLSTGSDDATKKKDKAEHRAIARAKDEFEFATNWSRVFMNIY